MNQTDNNRADRTKEGYPIVAPTDICSHWIGQSESSLCPIRECWYCRYADFRRDMDSTYSPCRCPENRLPPPAPSGESPMGGDLQA
ncbi:MAG: hypothetical protein RRY95_00980 [Oscillospiraceae bacterium]